MSQIYWAADTAENCVSELENYRNDYYKYLNDQGFMFLWNSVYRAYYAAEEMGPFARPAGEQGNLVSTHINDFRNLIQHKVSIVIGQNPTWEPMAISSDVKSTAQCKLAKSILNYYQDVKRVRVKATNSVLNAALFGESFVLQLWDVTAGARKYLLPNEAGDSVAINEGDIDQRVFEPVDVIRDTSIRETEQNHWYLLREDKNKYDTAAKFPEHYDDIVNSAANRDSQQHYIDFTYQQPPKDLTTVYTFVHRRTAACPKGRLIRYITPEIILIDSELPMQDFPVHRIIDTELKGKNFAYTDSFDMLGIQAMSNGLWSTIITNLNAFGVQNVLLPIGSNISESNIGGNLNVIQYDPQSGGVPSALQLTAQPDGIWNAVGLLGQKLETISGVNSTARGNPPPQVGSGVALSMLQSLNVQYSQGLQSSYIGFMESIGTAMINLIKEYAHLPRIASITGEANSSYIKEYKGSDMLNVNRVVVKLGNPMSNTIQGRYAIGEMLVSKGLIKDASQLLTVLETGNLDNLTDGRNAQLFYAKAVCEALRNAQEVPPPRVTDDHLLHIRMISELTSDIDIRTNRPDLLVNMDNQILAHMTFLQDPNVATLMVALQQEPLPPPNAQNTQMNITESIPQPMQPPVQIDMNTRPNVDVNKAAQVATANAQMTPTGQLPANFATEGDSNE